MGNALIFPRTPRTYSQYELDRIFWIPEALGEVESPPKTLDELGTFCSAQESRTFFFPAQLIHKKDSKYVLIYFHGNSCDMGEMCEELKLVSDGIGSSVIQIEYPGYGIMDMMTTTRERIDLWARSLVLMLTIAGVEPDSILCFGRSLGTGVAAKLGAWMCQYYGKCGGVILHSPFTSIHNLVTDMSFKPASYLFGNFWDTEQELVILQGADIPLLIVHSLVDEVIPIKHGKKLFADYEGQVKIGVWPETSEHNSYSVREDLINPIKALLNRLPKNRRVDFEVPAFMYGYFSPPPELSKGFIQSFIDSVLCCGQVAGQRS